MASPVPTVNFSLLQRYAGTNQSVRLIGRVDRLVGSNEVVLGTSDKGQVKVLTNAVKCGPYEQAYAEVQGKVVAPDTIQEESHVNFSTDVGTLNQKLPLV